MVQSKPPRGRLVWEVVLFLIVPDCSSPTVAEGGQGNTSSTFVLLQLGKLLLQVLCYLLHAHLVRVYQVGRLVVGDTKLLL